MIIPEVIQKLPPELPLNTKNGDDKCVSIPFDYWRLALVPSMSPIDRESGLENKYGGSVPFFREGNKWPTCSLLKSMWPYLTDDPPAQKIKFNDPNTAHRPLAFVCQFVDPFDSKKFVQIFAIDFLDDELNCLPVTTFHDNNAKNYCGAYIKRSKLPDLQKQIIIDPPDELISKNGLTKHSTAMSIDSWTLKYELDYLHLCTDDSTAEENILNFLPCDEFKLFGLGRSCQNVDHYRHYVQNIACGQYGDGGTLHIDDNGRVFGDMC